MLTGTKRIILADLESLLNTATGDRKKQVSRAKVIANTVELVGIQTAQVGQVQGFNLAYSVTVPRILYDSEKYVYFNDTLYEVKTMSKAASANDMLLNVQACNDNAAKKAVEEWINENL